VKLHGSILVEQLAFSLNLFLQGSLLLSEYFHQLVASIHQLLFCSLPGSLAFQLIKRLSA
jgi:hypothetical protein